MYGAGMEEESPAAGADSGPLLPQVFISYAGVDVDARVFAISVLKPALEAAGLKVFLDVMSLRPGSKGAPLPQRAATTVQWWWCSSVRATHKGTGACWSWTRP